MQFALPVRTPNIPVAVRTLVHNAARNRFRVNREVMSRPYSGRYRPVNIVKFSWVDFRYAELHVVIVLSERRWSYYIHGRNGARRVRTFARR